jgi:2-desacetyl-2-hydroxyethyl bacteriochlorophyllide A dehydrogenase
VRAVVARNGAVSVESVPDPVPAAGQVLARPVACGICGSDLHAVEMQAADPEALPPVVLGHEFCAEIVDYGPRTERRFAPGAKVCSVPFVDASEGPQLIGFSPLFPGGLAEQMVLQESRLVLVPDHVDVADAALTEPLAVGLHAVGAAGLTQGDVALVLGTGPVGLAVIAGLKELGHGPVVASDFSPTRRRLAEITGADVVVDPARSSPYEAWLELAGAPPPPSPLLSLGDAPANAVVFDCVGAPGLLQQQIEAVPQHSRLVVVGVCAQPDSIVPVHAIEKELSLRFVFAYRPDEFAAALALIADGRVPVGEWITDTRPLDGVQDAFTELSAPQHHCKILLTPTG